MSRKEMIRDLVYNDIYGDRDEFLKRVLKNGWLGYEKWDDAALEHACRMFGLLDEPMEDLNDE